MASITTWFWGASQLDEAVDKATSELLPAGQEDIALNLEICDQIRSKSVPAKDAMRALKRRLNHKNPNVQLLALGLADICVKNGGDHFLAEISSREFMDNLVSILKIPTLNVEVKNNILRLVQNWSVAFEGKIAFSYVGQVYKNLNSEGYKFPPQDLALANAAMVDTQTAPEWIDSDVCLRCRDSFSLINRKHHCRNCGQVFDQKCSAKSMPLPHFGITQEVRVCDGCYNKLSKKAEKADKGHRHSTSLHGARHRSARELADAELQRAIQLSLQEVGAAGGYARPGYVPSQPPASDWQYSEPPIVDRTTHPVKRHTEEEEEDPDLKAAIEASLREANAPKPSAPIAVETPRSEEAPYSYSGPGYSQSYPPGIVPAVPSLPNYDLDPMESDAILTFSQTVEQVQAQGGRDMSRYPAVNELYDKASSLRPKLALSLDDTGRKEQMLSDMHDKLSQAVKLYDQLLTEQVAHPRWRSPQPVAPVQYQQANSSYSTGYNTTNGYTQWATQAPVSSGYRSPSVVPQEYVSSPVQYAGTPVAGPSYATQPTEEASRQQSWQQQPQTQYPEQQSQYSQPSQQYVSVPASQFSQDPSHQPYQQYSSHVPSQPPPVSFSPPQTAYQDTQSLPASNVPVSLPQSPPPAQFAPPSVSKSPLPFTNPSSSRHNTLSYAASPPPPNGSSHLSRNNTVAHPLLARQQQQQQQQQQQAPRQQYTPAPSLPQFPAVPTAPPQSFPTYAPVSNQPERQEALLIDL